MTSQAEEDEDEEQEVVNRKRKRVKKTDDNYVANFGMCFMSFLICGGS